MKPLSHDSPSSYELVGGTYPPDLAIWRLAEETPWLLEVGIAEVLSFCFSIEHRGNIMGTCPKITTVYELPLTE